MAREGTRSATGNSKPRVFQTVDTAPAIARKPRAKPATTTKKAGAKPTGVTKKTAAPKKESTVAKKARCPPFSSACLHGLRESAYSLMDALVLMEEGSGFEPVPCLWLGAACPRSFTSRACTFR